MSYTRRNKTGSAWARGGKKRWTGDAEKAASAAKGLMLLDDYMDRAAALVERMVDKGHATIMGNHDPDLVMSLERFNNLVVELAARAAEVFSQWKGKNTAEAIKALRIYGAHTIQCNKGIEGASCDCGLDAALEAVKKLDVQ